MIGAGARDRRITFERAVLTQASPSGEPVLAWSGEATVWARVEPLQGVELFRAQQLEARADTRFRILYRPGITADERLRIAYGGRTYDIRSVAELGRREELDILAEAGGE